VATNQASVLHASSIITSFEVIYRETFHKANGYELKGWLATWELWEESGMTKNAFAQLLVQGEYFDKVTTINQNFGHIKWVIEENGYDEASEILADYSGMREIRDERYPKDSAKVKKNDVEKFDAIREAKKFTKAQLVAMLAVKG